MEARIHDGDDKVCPFDKDRNSIAVDVQNWTKHFDRRLLRCQSFDMYGNTGKYGSATKEHILIGDGQFSPHNMETMLDSMALYAVHLANVVFMFRPTIFHYTLETRTNKANNCHI